ncbi:hypothetical protein BO70DRAFT_324301 [Aspergillus heteromorphus CBS 117.55]|uniref:ERCC4 domain-containing protein n=1 Tax=Aspergillus heteromorphus CBS 117.55 TaxID=1448321 RepID=A0A317UZX9_9EURO|nr:uncharacterized protein BO70DRAFT_324301 [Aspergillus heteromorphus CBS 117.55]PWY66082.1 hypothetical protein BO70DRAFT_324301 [Aspergillus heteromorphus CBS 117.55]
MPPPEVISLLSSTPPPPIERREQLSIRRAHSNPPIIPAESIFSDEIDLAYDDDLDTSNNPSKRRRLSHDSTPVRNISLPPSKNPLFLFSDEDFILSSDPAAPKLPVWNGESDPIMFTSSVPEQVARSDSRTGTTITQGVGTRGGNKNEITIDDDHDDDHNDSNNDDDLLNEITKDVRRGKEEIQEFSDQIDFPDINELLEVSRRVETGASAFSNRTASLLASLEDSAGGTSTSTSKSRSKSTDRRRHEVSDDIDVDIEDVMPPPRKPPRKTTKPSNAEKEAKAKDREAAKAQRERDKQLEKERKLKLKEEKAREKQIAADIAEVNKLKVDKKESTPEMIVDLSSEFKNTSVGTQTAEFMRLLKVDLEYFDSAVPNVVKWRRKVRARYSDALGHWEPCAPHISDEEEHILCLVQAQEFVNMVIATAAASSSTTATTTTSPTLNQHIHQLKTAHPNRTPIYLIEGLTAWMRKNKNSRNRAYQAEVRRQMDDSQSSSSTSTTRPRSKKAANPETTPPIDDDTIEDALLDLQITHACLIHHTNAPVESAEWIKNFTEHISTVPYRRERMNGNDSAFCMDTGQVKPGENPSDTFVKMLQEVNRITASMAYGIASRYPSVVDLVAGMRGGGGAGLLEDVKKSANKNGALTDSRIGPAASRRLYKVFMGMDPSSTDV